MRFRYVIEIVGAAKRDTDFSLGSFARRCRRFVAEVLFQSKVIEQRPIAGAAHAFVFWGFCAFMWSRSTISPSVSVCRFFPARAHSAGIYDAFVALFAGDGGHIDRLAHRAQIYCAGPSGWARLTRNRASLRG